MTKAILKEEFGIDVDFRDDRLCPTVPSRVQYLKIIHQVLEECSIDSYKEIQGLDIGTGAYAIYPILGNKMYGWKMMGIDIDTESINNAKKVIDDNQLKEINLVENNPDLFFESVLRDHIFTFTMCNPPFFNSKDEMVQNSSFKEKLDRGSVIASDNELITQGGEVKFVKRMIDQSVQCPKINWFSSLLGKKSSIDPLIVRLKEINNNNYFIKDFQLGNTKRWIIFWSFQYKRPMIGSDYKKSIPTVVKFPIDLRKAEEILKDLPLVIERKDDEIVVATNGNVWSRAFRRKRMKPNSTEKSIFKISDSAVYWNYGPSEKIFQSFYTYLRKHL